MDNVSIFFLIFHLSGHFQVLDILMVFITKYLIYLTVFLIFILGFTGKIKERKAFLLAIVTIPFAILLINLLRMFYIEQRPFLTYQLISLTNDAPNSAFPSIHTTIMTIIAFAYIYFKSKWSLLFLTTAVFIGFSRIYVGVHYPIDILGGLITGLLALIIVVQLKKLLAHIFFR